LIAASFRASINTLIQLLLASRTAKLKIGLQILLVEPTIIIDRVANFETGCISPFESIPVKVLHDTSAESDSMVSPGGTPAITEMVGSSSFFDDSHHHTERTTKQ
jgi:hypothetical protein